MKITKGNNTYNIPGWALFIGLLVTDNIVSNLCKTWSYKKQCDTLVKVSEDKEEES